MRASHSSRSAVRALVERLLEHLGHGSALVVEVDRARRGHHGTQLAQAVLLARASAPRRPGPSSRPAARSAAAPRPSRAARRRRPAACPPPWPRRSAPRWPGARPAVRRAAAARPRGSARAAARPAWRCGARSRSARPGARRAPGRPSPSPGRRPPGRRGPSTAPGRSPRLVAAERPHRRPLGPPGGARDPLGDPPSSRASRPDPGARMTDTSGARLGVPRTSIRPSVFSGDRAGLAAESDRISMPSRPDLDVGPQDGAHTLARRNQ